MAAVEDQSQQNQGQLFQEQFQDLIASASSVPSQWEWKERLNFLIDEARGRLTELDRKEQIWKKILAKVKENAAEVSDKIVLDVGGVRFATSKSTLLRFDDTYFTILLGGGCTVWPVMDEKGKYFIDRNPKSFDYFLDYLREGTLELEKLTTSEVEKFISHCEYFMVPLPENLKLEWSTEYCASQIKVFDTRAEKIAVGPKFRYSGVLATLKNPPRFKVKVINRMKGSSLLIGLVPKSSYVEECISLQSVGYFIDVATGKILKCLNCEKNDIYPYRNRVIKSGSIVEVRLDVELKQISFRVDEIDYGVAFTFKDSEPFYPAVELHAAGDCVELV